MHIHETQGLRDPFDVIFISVKSYDTEWATALATVYLRQPSGIVVDFQNGINDERVAAVAGRERTLGCVITISAGMYEPGHAIRTDTGSIGFKIGEHDGKDTPRAQEIARIMTYVADQGRQVGVKTPINDKIVELVNAPGVGQLKPNPQNLDPLWAMVPH